MLQPHESWNDMRTKLILMRQVIFYLFRSVARVAFVRLWINFFPFLLACAVFKGKCYAISARFYLWFYRYMFRRTWSRRSVTAKRAWKQKASLRRGPINIKPWIEMERWKIKLDNTQKEIPEAMRACNKVFSNISSPPRWLLSGSDELFGLA